MNKARLAAYLRKSALGFLVLSAIVVSFVAPVLGKTLNADCRNPSTSLQALIDNAASGDKILITGTCFGQFLVSGGIKITLQGIGRNPTLDGNGDGAVLAVGENKNLGTDVTVSRLTLKNGEVGIESLYGTLTITQSVVTDNQQAGVTHEFSEMDVDASTIVGNGGVGIHDSYGTVTISKSWVVNNGGAGIDSLGTNSFAIERSVISGNRAGGIWNNNGRNMTLSHCLVADNTGGGGIFNRGSLSLLNSSVVDNEGSGVLNSNDLQALNISRSRISGNKTDGSGGGLYLDGSGKPVTIDHTIISDNSARIDGGGIYITNRFDPPAMPFEETDAITHNSAGRRGGGVCNQSSALIVPPNIVFDNSPDNFCQ